MRLSLWQCEALTRWLRAGNQEQYVPRWMKAYFRYRLNKEVR